MAVKILGSFLRGPLKDLRTGTLMCVGNHNDLGRVYVVEGKVVAARYGNKQGKEAFLAIRQTPFESIRFHEGRDLVRSRIAMHEELEQNLEPSGTAVENSMEDDLKSFLDTTGLALGDTSDSSVDTVLTPVLRELLINVLANYIGPAASMMVSDLNEDATLEEAMNSLAREIGDADSAIEFVHAVTKQV